MLPESFGRLSRRDFLAYCAAMVAALGLSDTMVPRVADALQKIAQGKPPVIWLSAQGCKGCQISLFNSDEPTPGQIVLDTLSLRYFPLLTASSGNYALSVINETVEQFGGEYVLLVEGTVPPSDSGKFDTMGFEQGQSTPVEDWVRRVAKGARATLAVGTCAAYGGIPSIGPTNGKDVSQILQEPVPAVPGCPPHPDWVVGTLVKLILFGKKGVVDELDNERRPKEFFGTVVHDICPRRAAFDAGVFVGTFNENVQAPDACLLTKGCKGPLTHSDCPKRRWNQGANWCIGAGAPCNGCTEPSFYAGFSPLFEVLPSVKLPGARPAGISAETIGGAIGAATAIGIGAHLVAQVARGKIGGRREQIAEPVVESPAAEEPAVEPSSAPFKVVLELPESADQGDASGSQESSDSEKGEGPGAADD